MSTVENVQAEFRGRDRILSEPQPCPCVYLFDNTRSGLSAAIRDHQEGDYSHCGTGLGFGSPGAPTLVDQVLTLRPSPLADYLTPDYRVKCVELLPPAWTPNSWEARVQDAQAEARRLLGLPWWRRLYDGPGVLGFALWAPRWFGLPGGWYCSEAVAHFATRLVPPGENVPVLSDHPTPAEVNAWLKELVSALRARVAWRYDAEIVS